MRRPLPLLRLRLLFARRLLPLPSLLFVVHPRDDVGVLHLMLQLVVPRGHVFRQRLRPPHLPRLLGRLGTFELAALRDVPRKWVDRRHATFNIGLGRPPGKANSSADNAKRPAESSSAGRDIAIGHSPVY